MSSLSPSTSSAQNPTTPTLTPEEALDRKVESILGHKFVPKTAEEFAEDQLKESQTLSAANELIELLDARGFEVERRFCRTKLEQFYNQSVIVLTIRTKADEEGKQRFVVPSINMVWDPTLPLDRDSGGPASAKKKVLTIELENTFKDGENPGMPRDLLSFETFSPHSPVHIVVGHSHTGETPVLAYPIFSERALSEARAHAAQLIAEHTYEKYSYVLHEVMYPAIRDLIKAENELFGERETPMLSDNGTDPMGRSFAVKGLVSDFSGALAIDGAVVEDNREHPSLMMRVLSARRD
jgi:hypothetical protein